MAASFKNISQFTDVALLGVDSITISSPDLLEQTIWHPYTDKSIADFEADWNKSIWRYTYRRCDILMAYYLRCYDSNGSFCKWHVVF